jgi:hypothetical protein
MESSASFDPDSNVTDWSDLHNERARFATKSTDAARQIDCNDEQSGSPCVSIQVNFDTDSNATDKRKAQPPKYFEQRISTDREMKIDFNDEQ